MAALIKALEYFGTLSLLGAGTYHYLIAPGAAKRWLWWGVAGGAALLAAASVADVTGTLMRLLGRFDLALNLEYLVGTNHGRLTLLRLGLLPCLLLAFRWRRGWPFAALGAGVLYSFSALSHAATMHGTAALATDLAHFAAASLWGGSVLYTALAWRTLGPLRLLALERVSRTGLFAVLLLSVTGVYTSTLHLESPSLLLTSPYGRVLSVKLGLVAVILGTAALNRWYFLPRFRTAPQRHQTFGTILLLEAVLLLSVFAATGLLTTSPLPHD